MLPSYRIIVEDDLIQDWWKEVATVRSSQRKDLAMSVCGWTYWSTTHATSHWSIIHLRDDHTKTN